MGEMLYLFNPENDMALAANNPFYMSPASTKRMAAELSTLPAWYAVEGSSVLIAPCALGFEKQSALMPDVKWATEISSIYNKVCPWGWNPALLRRLWERGVPDSAFPSAKQMERIRELSGRQTAVELLLRMNELQWSKVFATSLEREGECFSSFCGESNLLTTVSEVERYVLSHPEAVLKSPWSGSGRGIQYTSGEFPLPLKGWVEHVLHTQQTVVGEPLYNKVNDFAMEFYATADGEVRFVGYSFFETDIRGIYKENLLASDDEIEKLLTAYVSITTLRRVRENLILLLKEKLKGDYQGYLGVDMMICRTVSGYAVHPCVEVNLRMNMGVVSRLIFDKYICAGAKGRFVIEYYRNPGEAQRIHRELQQQYPLLLENNRIMSGYLSLTLVSDETAYQAYVVVYK